MRLTIDFDGTVGLATRVLGHAPVRTVVFGRQVADGQLEVRLVRRRIERRCRIVQSAQHVITHCPINPLHN